MIPVEAESVCPICSRGILDLDDNSSSYAAGWLGSLTKMMKDKQALQPDRGMPGKETATP